MNYFLIVGEASGDLHASNLMRALKQADTNAEFRYFGGDKSSQYPWDWKAHSPNGAGFAEYLNIFALPAEDVNANPNLKQNPGY